jgi:hypothetical protein
MRIQEFTIDDGADEGRALRRVMEEHGLNPAQAIIRILRINGGSKELTPGQRMLGAFSAPKDAAMMDEAVEIALQGRREPSTRDIGLEA